MLYLGIDTSCYTTSAATYDSKNGSYENYSKVLEVKLGQRGLKQSDGVFQHLKNLPDVYSKAIGHHSPEQLTAVCVSASPRNGKESYMPVFLTGLQFGHVIAETLKIPLYRFSHQEGHVMAGILSSGAQHLLNRKFLFYHISGGTTDLCLCKWEQNRFQIRRIGGTMDLNAGQLIDRVGVRLGLSFPCGAAMDKMAAKCEPAKLKYSVRGAEMNLSGGENQLTALIENGARPEEICYQTFSYLAENISRTLQYAANQYQIEDILMVGGVCANSVIRSIIIKICNSYFAEPELSRDNAAGIAALGAILSEGCAKNG